MANASGGSERAYDVLVGNLQSPERIRAEMRLASVQLLAADLAHPIVATAPSVVDDRGEAFELRLVPRDQQPTAPLERNADLVGVAEQQAVATGDKSSLEGAWLGVESGVEDRGVGLAGPGANVAFGLDQHQPKLEPRKLAGDRTADVARADDRDVVIGPAVGDRTRRHRSAAQPKGGWRAGQARATRHTQAPFERSNRALVALSDDCRRLSSEAQTSWE